MSKQTSAPVLVVGHKNPDNDAIMSALGYAYLKNALAQRDGINQTYQAARLGPLPAETEMLLEKYSIEAPIPIAHVHTRIGDVMTPQPVSITLGSTLTDAGQALRKHNVRSLVVEDDKGIYQGIISTRMVAERYISATDHASEGPDAVASDLIASLSQPIDEVLDAEMLALNEEDVLADVIDDILNSTLREAVVLDDDNRCIGIITRSDVANPPRRKVILTDHNEMRQAVNGIEEAEIVEVVDHHRIGDISTALPIRFTNWPVGSSCTIVCALFRQEGIDIPEGIAACLLSAIMTDTVILKSPTATDFDKEQVAYLESILGVNHVDFGVELFRARGGVHELPIEKLVLADSKEFQMGDSVVLIAQRETVDLPAVLEREQEIRDFIGKLAQEKGYEFVLLMVTDIIAEGSQFISEGNKRAVERIFNISCKDGSTWMPGVLSRKKQVAARILGA
ncbi:MAG: putative manganese-dependent inorganic diphosphatase [Eggerthellaceae bacterium]|nr:putative manganese-dependent inorganic diphosphatase [Eggerthellaceae bacterium]